MLLDRWMGRLGRHPPRLRHGPQREREEVVWGGGGAGINRGMVRGGGGGGLPPNQSESWQFNYKEIKGHSSFN